MRITLDDYKSFVNGKVSDDIAAEIRQQLAGGTGDATAFRDAFRTLHRALHCAPKDTNDIEIAQRRGACQPPARLEESCKLSAPEVVGAFTSRVSAEMEALTAFVSLSDDRFASGIEQLQAIVDQMRHSLGYDFLERDIKFHVAIAEAVDSGTTDTRCAYDYVLQLGLTVIASEEKRQEVCNEHQSIVDALREHDSHNACLASRRHLHKALYRWYPSLLESIQSRNKTYYDRMSKGAALLFTGWVFPLEWVRFKDTLGNATAAAVGRGAELCYVLPSQVLIDRWRRSKILAERHTLEPTNVQEEFRQFQHRIAEALTSSNGGFDSAMGLVRQRVFLLELDDDELFILTRPSQTLGYFYYPDSAGVLTERVALADGFTWDGIQPAPLAIHQLFINKVSNALEKHSRDGHMSGKDELALTCIKRWLPQQPEPEPMACG
jgi:DNA-binding FadR family transcriptional regulator